MAFQAFGIRRANLKKSPAAPLYACLKAPAACLKGMGLRSFVRGGEPSLRTKGSYHVRSVDYMVRHPRGSYMVYPLLWPHRKRNQFIWRWHPYARKSASQAVLSGMHAAHAPCDSPDTSRRFGLGASNAWSMKTRRDPSRHCRDARVYDHMTTSIHDDEHTFPPRH